MFSRDLQPQKVDSPIICMPSGRVMLVSEEQPEKLLGLISLTDEGIRILVSALQSRKNS